jgi:hypothetical protein
MNAPTGFIVLPFLTDVRRVEYTGQAREDYEKKFLATGKVQLTEIIGGNFIIHLKDEAITERDDAIEWAFDNREGDFADIEGFSGDEDGVLTIKGSAMILGPKDENGEHGSVTLTDIDGRIGFRPGNSILERLAQLMALREALGGGDNDNVDREEITDEKLAECGCGGCKEELASRVKAAGVH